MMELKIENKNMIPTAEEFFKKKHFPSGKVSKTDIDLWINTNIQVRQDIEFAIEFAKLHVREALKAAAENVDMDTDFVSSQQEGSIGGIDKETILNAYPETLIK